MIHVFIRHAVREYWSWRQSYEEAKPVCAQNGAKSATVYQSIDDPNDVTVVVGFDDWQTARQYAASDTLREIMARAGVRGRPDVWYTEVDEL